MRHLSQLLSETEIAMPHATRHGPDDLTSELRIVPGRLVSTRTLWPLLVWNPDIVVTRMDPLRKSAGPGQHQRHIQRPAQGWSDCRDRGPSFHPRWWAGSTRRRRTRGAESAFRVERARPEWLSSPPPTILDLQHGTKWWSMLCTYIPCSKSEHRCHPRFKEISVYVGMVA